MRILFFVFCITLLFHSCAHRLNVSFHGEIVHIGPTRTFTSLQQYIHDTNNVSIKNVHLLLDEGTYFSDRGIWFTGENVIIEGTGKVNLYCTALYDNVMWITGNNITVKNLRMKHLNPGDPHNQNCSGRVIGFDNASNVIVEGCDLNGCGLAGLHDNLGNKNILIRNNYIHNNSFGAYTDINGGVWLHEIKNHPVFRFKNNKMVNNGPDRVIEKDSL